MTSSTRREARPRRRRRRRFRLLSDEQWLWLWLLLHPGITTVRNPCRRRPRRGSDPTPLPRRRRLGPRQTAARNPRLDAPLARRRSRVGALDLGFPARIARQAGPHSRLDFLLAGFNVLAPGQSLAFVSFAEPGQLVPSGAVLFPCQSSRYSPAVCCCW